MDILEIAARKAEAAEVYEETRTDFSVMFRAGELEEVKSREVIGLALRVIHNGRLGFAATTKSTEDTLVAAALNSAQHGDPAPFRFPTPQRGEPVPVYDRTVLLPIETLVEWGEEAVQEVNAAFPEVKVNVNIYCGELEARIRNTSGGEWHERRSFIAMGVEAERVQEGDIWPIYVDRVVRRIADLDRAALVEELLRYLEWGRQTIAPPTGQPPVLLTPKGTFVLILPLLFGFSGLSVLFGTSPLRDRLGKEAFDRRLTILDDGTLPFGPRSTSFDDEGVPTRRLPLVEDGVVRNFYYDLRAAVLAEAEPTGSALRGSPLAGEGFRHPPAPGPRNIVIQPGAGTFAELIADMDSGIVVVDLIGLGQGNVASGAFSNNVGTGFVVKKGKVVGRLKDTMIAGNAYDVLKDGIKAIGADPTWVHGIACTPSLLVEGVSVISR